MAKKTKKKTKQVANPTKKIVKEKAKPALNFPKFNKFNALIIGITLIGLLIRVYNLGGLTLWVDEYVHVLGVRDFLAGKGSLMPYDGNGFLYNLFILPFFAIFGDGAFWGRLPSALAGAAAIYMVYILCKYLLNKEIAVYAAFLTAFSVYLVFWSKVARNYSLFLFTYLLLLWTFEKAMNPNKKSLPADSIWQRFEISPKYLGFTIIALTLAFFSHKLVLFFFFSAIFYILFLAVDSAISNKKVSFENKFILLGIPSLIFLILFFTPALTNALRPVMGNLIPKDMVTWVLPDWTEIGRLWKEEQYDVFNIYKNIITYCNKWLYHFGVFGFLATFFINRRVGYFLLSFFVIPLLLMSFVLRGVYNPRYLVFLYPLFLVSMACGVYFLLHWLPQKFMSNTYHAKLYNFSLFLPFLLFIGVGRFPELIDYIQLKKKSGYVLDKRLGEWSFTNWKAATDYLKANMKEGDVVMTTLPNATNYYMGWKDGGALQFRQKYLDITTGEYVNYEKESSNLDAQSVENLERTLKENPRGWLLADYYIETIYTAGAARNLIYKNTDFHFDATETGDVLIFSWDLSKPRVYPKQHMLELIGRKPSKRASQAIDFDIPAPYLNKPKLAFDIATQGVDSKKEAFFVLNNQYKFYIDPNKTSGVEVSKVEVETQYIKSGANSIQFGYEEGAFEKDPRRGFSIHSVLVR